MSNWLDALTTLITQPSQTTTAILVTVAQVEGSGPREPGAKMVVTAVGQFDTIGGGHLELQAIRIAREMLDEGLSLSRERRLQRFSLGPSLGQCCGGVVHLAFERVTAAAADYFSFLQRRLREGEDSWRLVALDDAAPPALTDGDGERLHGPGRLPTLPSLSTPSAKALGACLILRDDHGRRWLLDACLATRPLLFLFGAGHVGAAIVKALGDLPCRVVWIDEREEMFPDQLPANVCVEATDTPEALVDSAPDGSSFLVMTHNHALDQRLSAQILQRDGVAWFGLIGSKSKRMQFEHRLHERGIALERLADMVCPIGIPGIIGKEPAVIAASVTAQLLQVWEQIAKQQQTAAPQLRLQLVSEI
ncbi:xanthine dehydrogenase accessory protein XdhC [Collimonas sp.]|jgi:xanthine dehydrogenase accessory factor|uniref:xanthine dehydrogenase accessory protein XdhC n=1 Tax=Collimonas sp. TaxID=1963772 RepID=UPI002C564DC1|nr:xanthine dehydrogenase accessory protein XdhC [Collimonas sp.]HWW06552.1 xanthine dehydrogenase accessory protein XdhC [Collimonas sp.]